MAENNESGERFGSWVNKIQLLVALLTAAFSLYLNVQQSKIKEKLDDLSLKQQNLALAVSNKAETEKFVQQTLSYVETRLSIPDPKKKEALIIDLLDAIALANVSQEGATDSQKILHTPLWIALATDNYSGPHCPDQFLQKLRRNFLIIF